MTWWVVWGSDEGADDGGVVDDVVGGVGAGVLLDMHLGHMVDGLVDLGHHVVGHHRGVGVGHGGGVGVSHGGGGGDHGSDSLNLNGLDLNGLDGGGVDDGGVVDEGGVGVGDSGGGGHNGGGVDHGGGNSLADGVDKAVLVDVLGEALQGDGAEATLGGDKVAEGGGERTSGQAGVDVGLEEQLGVSLGAGGGQSGAEQANKRKRLHVGGLGCR